ncbi:hypothetical protein AM571_PC00383 (plasmid) [Rhizobium etli 8C-3]|uniref:Uncharacterized protein n=2 Tax=Rhizobium TaxID=379 RepID=A0A4R3RX70_9HYPH|nr:MULTISPECIES: hypothetical protein [Rhizobium]APO78123.1 hypothetical protein AM571_PC00383 [Rhizobium etli 8C-3]TCU31079.1 hypothetical protein EV130_101654 [Rhizobium azibense]TCU40898.1 hypothetical protein EV129_101185 [Rhizobium azibense]
MSTTSASNPDGPGQNARSIDELDELIALARMITYARYAAQDVELVSATHWLDLALKAVTREIGDVAETGLPDLALSVDVFNLHRH